VWKHRRSSRRNTTDEPGAACSGVQAAPGLVLRD
jgi:hypothetical protein